MRWMVSDKLQRSIQYVFCSRHLPSFTFLLKFWLCPMPCCLRFTSWENAGRRSPSIGTETFINAQRFRNLLRYVTWVSWVIHQITNREPFWVPKRTSFLGALPVCLSAYLCNMILPPWLNAVLFYSPPSGTHQEMEKGALVRYKETPPQERKHVACSN